MSWIRRSHADQSRDREKERARLREVSLEYLRQRHPQAQSESGTTPATIPDRALLIVGVQNDFCRGGALPVPMAERVVPVLNLYIHAFDKRGLPVYLARDWHPPETSHFIGRGGRWPPHCVRGTAGAAFHPVLHIPVGAVIISKGTTPGEEAYSAFEGHHPGPVSLRESLEARHVHTLYIGGLATDYCVRATVLDALRNGFRVVLLADAVRGIGSRPGDVKRAIDEMRRSGARVARIADVERELASTSAPPGPGRS